MHGSVPPSLDHDDSQHRQPCDGITWRLDPGLQRDQNEDWCGWFLDRECSAFVVCEGMGGFEHGELASRAAGREFLASIAEENGAWPDPVRLASRLETCLAALQTSTGTTRVGTTLTGLILHGTSALLLHVGDSRAYLLRDGRIIQLSRDHTVVDELGLPEKEAVSHPHKHMLTRAVGIPGLELDRRRFHLQPGDRLLMCSDGFWNAGILRRDLMGMVLSTAGSDLLADALLAEAHRRDAPDNLSILILDVDGLN